MVNQYETVFIATPVLSETQMKEAVAKYTKLITDNGGEIVYQEDWGLRQLAYPIQHKTTGFYYLIEFKASSLPPSKPSITVTSASSASSLSLLTRMQLLTQKSVAQTRLQRLLPPPKKLPLLNNLGGQNYGKRK